MQAVIRVTAGLTDPLEATETEQLHVRMEDFLFDRLILASLWAMRMASPSSTLITWSRFSSSTMGGMNSSEMPWMRWRPTLCPVEVARPESPSRVSLLHDVEGHAVLDAAGHVEVLGLGIKGALAAVERQVDREKGGIPDQVGRPQSRRCISRSTRNDSTAVIFEPPERTSAQPPGTRPGYPAYPAGAESDLFPTPEPPVNQIRSKVRRRPPPPPQRPSEARRRAAAAG